jgi:hypothetical protein
VHVRYRTRDLIRISRARRRARCSGYRGRATPSTLVRAESAGPPGPVGGVVVSSLGMSASGSSPEEAPAGGESLERQLSRGTVEKQYTKKELGRPLCKNLIHLNQLMVVHLVFMGTSILAPCHYIAVHTDENEYEQTDGRWAVVVLNCLGGALTVVAAILWKGFAGLRCARQSTDAKVRTVC